MAGGLVARTLLSQSCVSHAVTVEPYVFLAKGCRLEVLEQDEEGYLQQLVSMALFAEVADMQAVSGAAGAPHVLIAATDGSLCLVAFAASACFLEPVAAVKLQDVLPGRRSHVPKRLAVDSRAGWAACVTRDGRLCFLSLRLGGEGRAATLEKVENGVAHLGKRKEKVDVVDVAVAGGRLLVLSSYRSVLQEGESQRRLQEVEYDEEEKAVKVVAETDLGDGGIVGVAVVAGTVLLLEETSVSLFCLKEKRRQCVLILDARSGGLPPTPASWCSFGPSLAVAAADSSLRLVSLEEAGTLGVMEMSNEADKQWLGSYTCLVEGRSGFFVLFGRDGDGRVCEVDGRRMTSVTEIPSWAPLSSCCVAKLSERSEQICAVGGTKGSGTVHSFRTGVSMQCLMSTSPGSFPNTLTGMWVLDAGANGVFLILSFLEATRAIRLEKDGGMEDVTESFGFLDGVQTLCAGVAEDLAMVQVTASGVTAVTAGESRTVWEAEGTHVTASAVRGREVILVTSQMGSCSVKYFRLARSAAGAVSCSVVAEREMEAEVTFVYLPPESQMASLLSVCIVGTYEPGLEVLSLREALVTVASTSLAVYSTEEATAIPHSAVSVAWEGVNSVAEGSVRLMVGLRDGSVVSFSLLLEGEDEGGRVKDGKKPDNNTDSLIVCITHREHVRLGLHPVTLLVSSFDGRPSVVAGTDQLWLLSEADGTRLTAVNGPKVSHVVSHISPDSEEMIVAFGEGSLHVTVLQASPDLCHRRLASVPDVGAFVVVCSASSQPIIAVSRSHIVALDRESERVMAVVAIGDEWAATSLVVLPQEDGADYGRGLVVVGCVRGSEGAVRVWQMARDASGMLELAFVESATAGEGERVLLAEMSSRRIAVTCGKSLGVMDVGGGGTLRVAELALRAPPLCAAGYGQKIAVGVLEGGVQLYEVAGGNHGLRLVGREEMGRCVELISCQFLAEDMIAATTRQGTAYIVSHRPASPTESAMVLTTFASFSLGQAPLRLLQAQLSSRQQSSGAAEKALVATAVAGGVVAFVSVVSRTYKQLAELENTLRLHPATRPLLGSSHTAFRAATFPRKGVVDGDLLALFLEEEEETQMDIVQKTWPSLTAVKERAREMAKLLQSVEDDMR